ncbi:conserved hypothetical protein [uncultured Defluviicoccus sp.]|uniref:Uncharacterized protein n=1 Tax=metagenome TaxID=256318 RepID=A0A380TFG9_9ZZZZ|nr:conserved hypothetical protein [uncultured Defluviicoccus sp.]
MTGDAVRGVRRRDEVFTRNRVPQFGRDRGSPKEDAADQRLVTMPARQLTRTLGGRWHGRYGLARCPGHKDHDPSLSIADGTNGRLLLHCFAGCRYDALIDALLLRGLGEHRAHELATSRAAPVQRIAQRQQHATLSIFHRTVWGQSRSITADTPEGEYLTARGCALPHPDGDLRGHPALEHPCGRVGPALVGLITDVRTNEPINLHRTWIANGGSGAKAFDHLPKEECPPARLLLKDHRKKNGVIRLWPDDWVTLGLGITEGVESALTLARAFTPVWATIDAGNLKDFPYLYPIESLTVGVDHDPAGIAAFEGVKATWLAAGAEVRRVLNPLPGKDLNDWGCAIDAL